MKKKVEETGLVLTDDTGEMAYHVEVRKSIWNKVRYGSYAVIFTLIFVALMIGLNVFAAMAADRFDLTWDLTDEQVFTVSDQTVEYLHNLEEDVELILLNGDEDTWREKAASGSDSGTKISVNRYIVETLDRYVEESDHVKLYFLNQMKHPGFLKERNNLPVTDDLGDDPVLIIYSPATGRYRYVRQSAFANLEALTFEYLLNTGIRYATNPSMKSIAIIAGHDEDSLEMFRTVMTNDGYQVDTLVLPDVKEIPSEYHMIVISNPKRMYSADDITKIDNFLSNNELQGKSMMVFADLNFCSLQGDRLRPYLEEWGIRLEETCIYDPENTNSLVSNIVVGDTTMKKPTTYKVNFSEEAKSMTGTLASGNFNLRFELGLTRPLTKLFDQQQNITVYSLLKSFDTSFAREQVPLGTDLSVVKKTAADEAGPFDVGLLALRHRYDNLSTYATSVAVFGSDSLVNDYFISNLIGDSQATQEYVTQLIYFMAAQSEDEYEHIQTVSLELSGLKNLDKNSEFLGIWGITVGLVPLLFIVAAVTIWRIRKHL